MEQVRQLAAQFATDYLTQRQDRLTEKYAMTVAWGDSLLAALFIKFAAAVAQMVEQRTCNAKVGGSIPSSGSKITEAELDSIIEGCTKGNSHGEHGVPARLHMDRIVSCLNKYFAGEWKPVLSGASDDHNAVSKAADEGSTPSAPAIPTCRDHNIPINSDGTCSACDWWGHKTFIMINPRLFVQDLTKRDHLPEGSY